MTDTMSERTETTEAVPVKVVEDSAGQQSEITASASSDEIISPKEDAMSAAETSQPATEDEMKQIFCGGLAWATTSESLRRYFSQFGDITECEVIFDKKTGKSRGYGFVTFAEAASASMALTRPTPVIDGREVS